MINNEILGILLLELAIGIILTNEYDTHNLISAPYIFTETGYIPRIFTETGFTSYIYDQTRPTPYTFTQGGDTPYTFFQTGDEDRFDIGVNAHFIKPPLDGRPSYMNTTLGDIPGLESRKGEESSETDETLLKVFKEHPSEIVFASAGFLLFATHVYIVFKYFM